MQVSTRLGPLPLRYPYYNRALGTIEYLLLVQKFKEIIGLLQQYKLLFIDLVRLQITKTSSRDRGPTHQGKVLQLVALQIVIIISICSQILPLDLQSMLLLVLFKLFRKSQRYYRVLRSLVNIRARFSLIIQSLRLQLKQSIARPYTYRLQYRIL